ncbi:UPF0764 protein C16orf89 homolog isoform X1 [Caretta caretta]|uniref:UPF0764 protein C16orf89 homolog isoform X1 n=1 Tax=Caretta caretta TaxID=8467 RepID=UPI003F4B17A1
MGFLLSDLLSEFEPILGRNFWMLPHSWNQTNSSLAYSMFDGISCFTEEMSDKCFTYLLGTWKDNGKSCIVTRACRNIMTKFGCSDYSLSHQLFYFMFADMKGCSDHLFLRAQYYKNIFCACMMKINLVIESTGFRFSSRDLFMENNENSEHPSRVKDQEQLLRRVKRREKVFADGCSFHNTATAVRVLWGFLYYY